MSRIIDLTHLIHNGLPPFPGDSETVLEQSRFYAVDEFNNHQLTINMHAGTHIDGPMHLLDIHTYLHEIPIDRFIGDACLLDVSGQDEIDYMEAYESQIQEGQIVVLHTGWGKSFGQSDYFTDYPVLTLAFGELLVRKRVPMVCMDMPSPDKEPYSVHKLLFSNEILIAENLNNIDQLLDAGSFEIIALPLRIQADSSIARIVARVKD